VTKRALKDITRKQILGAINIHKGMGREGFLAHFGFKPSHTFKLRYKGTDYDSKAIIGVAAGLAADEFSGGTSRLLPVCRRCEFQLVNVKTGEEY
jgi:hypothetical protein